MTTFTVDLKGGSPWGFRITGGREFDEPITVSKINPNSKAYVEGLKVGDAILAINQQRTHGLNYGDAQQLIKNATQYLQLVVARSPDTPHEQVANGGLPKTTSSHTKPPRVETGQDSNSASLTPSLPPAVPDAASADSSLHVYPGLRHQGLRPDPDTGQGLLKFVEAVSPSRRHEQGDLTFDPSADLDLGTERDAFDDCSTSSNSTSTTSDSYAPSPIIDMNHHSHNGTFTNGNGFDSYFDLDSSEGGFRPESSFSPKYSQAIKVPQLSPSPSPLPAPKTLAGHRQSVPERGWSSLDHSAPLGPKEKGQTSALTSPPGMLSKRPILPPASPKVLKHEIPQLSYHHHQQQQKQQQHPYPVSSHGSQAPAASHSQPLPWGRSGSVGSAHDPQSPPWGRSSGVGKDGHSPQGQDSRGMSLFRRQQEKLAQMGADTQEITISQPDVSGHSHRSYDLPQTYSAQSSPGGVGHFATTRSLSVDEGARTVPIIVQTSSRSQYQPAAAHRTRTGSENADLYYNVRPAHDLAQPGQLSGYTWEGEDPRRFEVSDQGKNFGAGSYATLPAKSSATSHHRDHLHQHPYSQQQQQQQHRPHQQPESQQQPKFYQPEQQAGSGHREEIVPVTEPLSVEADQPINDFDYHIYSTLPTIKPLLRSNNTRPIGLLPLDLPELEKERKFQDYTKPLWTNIDLATSSSHTSDSHSPPSDNAVSSSDSRDTIIARSDETRSSHTDSTTQASEQQPPQHPKTESAPKMIPVRVVHEDIGLRSAGRSPAEFDSLDQPWGKRVVEGADQTYPYNTLEPSRSLHDKLPDQVNGLKSPTSFNTKTGVWSPGVSPASSVKSEPISRTQNHASPPEHSFKNIAPVWKPSGSPAGIKKEYRPVRLNANIKPIERKKSLESSVKPEESFAWQPSPSTSSSASDFSRVPTSALRYTPMSSEPSASAFSATDRGSSSKMYPGSERTEAGQARLNGDTRDSAFRNGKDNEIHLPSTQSPYITLLQKSRENEKKSGDLNLNHIGKQKPIMVQDEGQIPRGAQYLGQKVTVDGDKQHTDTYYAAPTEEKTTTAKTVEVKPVVYEGIGPLDNEGVPLAFRKNVQEEKQHDWYRQMYKSLHRTDKKEDRLGINDMIDSIFEKAEENKYQPTYKFPEDISDTKSEEDFNPYRPAYEKPSQKGASSSAGADDAGYRSEPEGRYKDLFRKHRSVSEREATKEPRRNFSNYHWCPASVRSKIEVYRNQPRSIMDYEPGFSSIAIREAKTGNQFNPPISKPGELSQYSVGKEPRSVAALNHDDRRQDGDGADPRDTYRRVQSGGDIPAKGLQKPAPDKPSPTEPSAAPPAYSSSSPSRPKPPSVTSSPAAPTASSTFPRGTNAARQFFQQGDTLASQVLAPAPPARGGSGSGLSGSRSGGYLLRTKAAYPSPSSSSASTSSLPRAGVSAVEQLGVRSPPPPGPFATSSPSPLFSSSAAGLGSVAKSAAFGGSSPTMAAREFKHQTSDVRRPKPEPISPEKERRRRQEEEAYRKKRLEELQEEERQKKIKQDQLDQEARRHHDYFMEAQKSPISPNRFDDTSTTPLSPSQPGSLGTLGRRDQPLSVPPERRRGFQIQGKARALYNFNAQNPRELSFRKNDTIYLLRQIDKNWYEGEKHGVVGIFPVNYVEVVTSIEAAKAAAMQAEGQGRAKYNFTAQSGVELSLRKGEFVVLLRRVDENWYEGRVGNRQGIFPVNYVEIAREPSTPLITPAPSVITTPMTGTPEMLSPVGYDPAPTPPPQPSPSAFANQRSPGYGYSRSMQQPGYSGLSSQAPYTPTSPSQPYQQASRHQAGLLKQEEVSSPKSPASNPKSPIGVRSPRGPNSQGNGLVGFGPTSALHVDIHSKAKPYANGQPRTVGKVADDDLALTRYRAVYTYRPQNEDELELREGDEVFVMEKCDDGWFVGTSARTGCFGTFPGNYVQKI